MKDLSLLKLGEDAFHPCDGGDTPDYHRAQTERIARLLYTAETGQESERSRFAGVLVPAGNSNRGETGRQHVGSATGYFIEVRFFTLRAEDGIPVFSRFILIVANVRDEFQQPTV